MAKNNKKNKKSSKKVSNSLKKNEKSVSKAGCSGAKAAQYVENLLELHKLQGTLLVHLQKEFMS